MHITLIDYKALYKDSLRLLKETEEENNELSRHLELVKHAHNESVKEANRLKHEICRIKTECLEKDESRCDALGGEGSLDDRIDGARRLISSQHDIIGRLKERLVEKDARIAELMKEGITDKDEALMELHQSYQRLHDDYYSISELYDNAQKTIDRLCSNE